MAWLHHLGRRCGDDHRAGLLRARQCSFLGLTLPVWTMIGCFVVFGVLLNMTSFGRNVLATGGNAEAAAWRGSTCVA